MLTARYALLQSSYWGTFCLVISFASVYLLAGGISNAEIGIVLAVAGLLSAVAQPVLAGAAERSRRPLRVWIVVLGLVLAAAAVLLLVPGGSRLVTSLVYGFLIAAVQVVQPLVNAVGMDALNVGRRLNFGLARAAASLAFALIAAVAGRVVEATSETAIPLIMLGVLAVFIASAGTFVVRSDGGSQDGDHHAAASGAVVAARTSGDRARFVLLLAGLTLAMASHNLLNGFMFQLVSFHGAAASAMGVAIMIAALTELPTMGLWNRIVARWTPGLLLVVSGVAFAVKALATYLAPNLLGIYLAQALQFAAFGLLVPASVYYINRLFPPSERVKGQAYMTMTATAGSVVGSLAGGLVLQSAGVPSLLLLGVGFATVGAALTWAGANRA